MDIWTFFRSTREKKENGNFAPNYPFFWREREREWCKTEFCKNAKLQVRAK